MFKSLNARFLCLAVCASLWTVGCGDDDPADKNNSNPNTNNTNVVKCGNDKVEGTETCDGDCPTSCDDTNACTTDTLSGSAAMCDVLCKNDPITACTNGDGCCAPGCDSTNDDDCEATDLCGNGQKDPNETCDGDCPTSCDDTNACTTDTLTGTADKCDVVCANTAITACTNGDGCCAPGCNDTNDDDCMAADLCGNGQPDPNETCDGDCPTSCDDADVCTTDTLSGTADKCDVVCANTAITTCTNGDGCCAPGCDSTTDDDCMPPILCGNGLPDPNETCDGNCPASCDDADACTTDVRTGSDNMCDVVCTNTDITACTNGDGCCAPGCDNSNDDDCAVANTPGSVGTACQMDTECQPFAGLTPFCATEQANGFPGGYCTLFSCANDSQCPQGTHCDPQSQACLDSCNTAADCTRTDYTCRPQSDGRTACFPDPSNPQGADPGAACTQASDCKGTINAGGACITQATTQWPGGYCLGTGCMIDTDCPTNSHCDNSLCYPDCTTNADCTRAGYECVDFFDTGRTTCAPAATTAAAVGESCVDESSCLGGLGASICIDNAGWTGNYCATNCVSDSDCRSGTHCGFIDATTGDGTCVDSCTTQAECRAGYDCLDTDTDNKTECFPSATGTGVTGDACANLSECGGGQNGNCLQTRNFQDGYCVVNNCNAQNPCAAGSHCGFLDAQGDGTCVADCTANSCRTGYACFDADQDTTNECFPSATGAGAVGEACVGIYECFGGQDGTCLGGDAQPDWKDGYCAVRGCTAQAGCLAGNHCAFIDAMTGEGICVDTCAAPMDCRAGYDCYDIDTQGTLECAPSGVGTGLIGQACTGVYECGGGRDATCIRGDEQTPWPDGYCSDNCTNSACPQGSVCLLVNQATNDSFCFDGCTLDTDCRNGYTCQTFGTDQICAP